MHMLESLGCQRDVSLGKYTAARLGGPTDWLYITAADERPDKIAQVAMAAWDAGLTVRTLGAGANVLVSDAGLRGLTIINRANTALPAGRPGRHGMGHQRAGHGRWGYRQQCWRSW